MVAHADAAIRPPIPLEGDPRRRHPRHAHYGLPLSSGGSAIRPSAAAGPWPSRPLRSPRPRALETLCVCTCAPAGISVIAIPIGLPYFITDDPAGMARSATLCPRGIGSRTVIDPAAASTVPGDSVSSAVPTLSAALMTITCVTG